MLNNHERGMLDGLEERLRAEDPEFASRLNRGQQSLPTGPRRRGARTLGTLAAVLAVLALLLFVLGIAGPAVLLAGAAAAMGWLSSGGWETSNC